MQKDFQTFRDYPTLESALVILKHKDKISAQCIYGQEIQNALTIVSHAVVDKLEREYRAGIAARKMVLQ